MLMQRFSDENFTKNIMINKEFNGKSVRQINFITQTDIIVLKIPHHTNTILNSKERVNK